MKTDIDKSARWRKLGWSSPFWELVRFYCSLRGNEQKKFLLDLKTKGGSPSATLTLLGLSPESIETLTDYIQYRTERLASAISNLRSEEEALAYCKAGNISWVVTKTKSRDHHQSSRCMIATVSHIAGEVCSSFKIGFEISPQRRCVWNRSGHLHVSVRNLDGAVPGLQNPFIIWEIKEYWGKTSGGSKMSDAVYECHLVGKEIRDCEQRASIKIFHAVFVDGREQWLSRKSDLARFLDLESQGLIDHLFVGRDVETQWEKVLKTVLKEAAAKKPNP